MLATAWHRWARRAAAASSVILVTLAACDTFPANQRIGAEPARGRGVEILYVACPSERLESVSLIDVVGARGGTDDVTLWEIEAIAANPAGIITFNVGKTPPGFREVKPLSSDLPPGLTTAVVTTSFTDGAAITFDPATELKVGHVTAWDLVTREEFEAKASSSCP